MALVALAVPPETAALAVKQVLAEKLALAVRLALAARPAVAVKVVVAAKAARPETVEPAEINVTPMTLGANDSSLS